MHSGRFDAVARRFAERRLSRRQALTQGAAALAAGAAVMGGLAVAGAQDGTPTAQDGATPAAGADSKLSFLFVQ